MIDTDSESGFQVTVDQLDNAYTERTKVLLFVSPDNPSGAVYPPEAVKAIVCRVDAVLARHAAKRDGRDR